MADVYKVADTHDQAEGSMSEIDPQPSSTGVEYARVVYGGDGTPTFEGAFIRLVWTALNNPTQVNSILTAFGLNNSDSNEISLRAPDSRLTFDDFNGLAVRPVPGDGLNRPPLTFPSLEIIVREVEAQ